MQHMAIYCTMIKTDRAVIIVSKLLIWLYGYIYLEAIQRVKDS